MESTTLPCLPKVFIAMADASGEDYLWSLIGLCPQEQEMPGRNKRGEK